MKVFHLFVYVKKIRSLLGLAQLNQSADIERVQKVAVKVILSELATGKSDLTYDMALVVLDLEPLEVRRERLCLSFAKKTLKSRHKDMFPENCSQQQGKTVLHQNVIQEDFSTLLSIT